MSNTFETKAQKETSGLKSHAGLSAVPASGVDVNSTIKSYLAVHDDSKGDKSEERKTTSLDMVNAYYDLVTEFYIHGWGEGFHFASRAVGETFLESIKRHEYWLGHMLQAQPGDKIVDLGCGIGGPMRNVSRFLNHGVTKEEDLVHIVGANNNAHQIAKGKQYNIDAGLDHCCSFLKCSFMDMPVEDGEFDRAFAVEATCHAPDKNELYAEIFRVLKPGGTFFSYEWCLTPRYDPQNREHQEIKKGIEVGDGLPDMDTMEYTIECLEKAGFEIVFERDVALDSPVPWYESLSPSFTLEGFRRTWAGRMTTRVAVSILEALWLAPKGTTETSDMLNAAADALVAGGETGIFTPMYAILVRKPE